jgi:hypothetical protein
MTTRPPKPTPPKIRLLCTHCGADHNVKPCKCQVFYGCLLTFAVIAVTLEVLAVLIFGGPLK